MSIGIQPPTLLLPSAGVSLEKWAVVACDQYTSQLSYWEEVERLVGDAPSTLHMIFPEVYLGQDDTARIAKIQSAMKQYLAQNLLTEHKGFIVLQRTTQGPHGPHTRSGLMAVLDLETYDFNKGSQSLTRATEGTILDRLPPRIKIREGAPLELPHVMLLIDDPNRTVIEPLLQKKDSFTKAYDIELMQGGGHLTGYAVSQQEDANILNALEALASSEVFANKYALDKKTAPLLFAVGDGNHSLATAKSVWEKLKAAGANADHPGRFALVEIVNVHDEGLDFEPIHRVLFGVKQDFLTYLQQKLGADVRLTPMQQSAAFARAGGTSTHKIAYLDAGGSGVIEFLRPTQNLPVATLQLLLDQFMKEGGAESIDYVHGTDAVTELGAKPKHVGLYLPPISKSDFFKTVIVDGALPRKTFSMGEAFEKRFYLECRRILPTEIKKMNRVRDAFCSYCGTAFAAPLKYPRKCTNTACGVTTWANPIPVSVVLVPVLHNGKTGLLVVRRAIEPRKGLLAVVGGFLEEHETWQQGGAREIVEETGIKIDHAPLQPFWYTSTEPRPNRVLLFSTAPQIDASTFTAFEPSDETSERGLVFGPDGLAEVFAFPLHAEAARRFFAERGITGPHDYTQL